MTREGATQSLRIEESSGRAEREGFSRAVLLAVTRRCCTRLIVGIAALAILSPGGLARDAAGGGQAGARSPGEAVDLAARAARAERLARDAMRVIRLHREREPEAATRQAERGAGLDPDRAALIGAEHTPLVTTLGSLESKHLATDPRWARVLVEQLWARSVRPGTLVAASFSGSFPGLNIAAMAACGALEARLVAVSSVTASTWGANEPGTTWPEMEAAIVAAGVLPAASQAVSVGGGRDRGRDLEPQGLEEAKRIQAIAARALGARVLTTWTLAEAVRARLDVYRAAEGGPRPRVYVNVGGNHASLGGADAPLRHDEGWLLALPPGADRHSSVTHEFLADGVPVLNLLNVRTLAREWSLETTR